MTNKVHGFTKTSYEGLTGNMDFFTVRTTVAILTDGQDVSASFVGAPGSSVLVGSAVTQSNLDVLVQTIAMRAAPVIMSPVAVTRESTPVVDLPGAADESDGKDTVYTLKFAVEHADAWSVNMLVDALNSAAAGFVFTTPTTGNNVAVTKNLNL
jgi:hypothetical protein